MATTPRSNSIPGGVSPAPVTLYRSGPVLHFAMCEFRDSLPPVDPEDSAISFLFAPRAVPGGDNHLKARGNARLFWISPHRRFQTRKRVTHIACMGGSPVYS